MTEDNTPRLSREEAHQFGSRPVEAADGSKVAHAGKLTTPEERMAALAAGGPYLVLWTAATLRTFTVCRPDRTAIWHSRFHADVVVDNEEDAAKAGALQAIWLAARARDEWGADVATLRLIVARPHVDRSMLDAAAISSGLILDLAVDAISNPALNHPLECWINWWSRDLGALVHNPQGLV